LIDVQSGTVIYPKAIKADKENSRYYSLQSGVYNGSADSSEVEISLCNNNSSQRHEQSS